MAKEYMMQPKRKVLVIGLDCAAPALVFDAWLADLPNIKKLVSEGLWGRMFSSIPPITCPAWMCMMTSKNPGKLGIFGFRNRSNYAYKEIWIANSTVIKEPTLWDIISREGLTVGLIGVPQTYPPRPVNGFMVTDFLAPDTSADYTYPSYIKDEIKQAVGDYILDCDEFRTENKDALLAEIYEMTKKRFDLVEAFLTKSPDFYMFVEMGIDRIYHGFWKYMDKTHRKYVAGNKYENSIKEYHQYIDKRIGELLKKVGDDTVVLVVSDHGAKKMEGAININDWLVSEGYLKLDKKPEGVVKMDKVGVDWANTTAWGLGGYYGRLFLNVKGREAQGKVDPKDYERIRDEIAAKLRALKDEKGRLLGTRVIKPQEVYKGPHLDQSPDLIIYFGDLYWRSTGNVGHDSIHSFETEVGPDDAVHDEYGIFVMWDPRVRRGKEVKGISLYDIAPTVLDLMGIPVPADMEGKVIKG
jgi:predicted AlkP superfamily phosphohydrolase/phosphomutase